MMLIIIMNIISLCTLFQTAGLDKIKNHSYVIMNVTNRNQSLVKSEIRHYFIRLTIYIGEFVK